MKWIDNHCHLDDEGAAAAIGEAGADDVARFIDVGCDLAGSHAAIARAERFDEVFATAGVHPHDASQGIQGIEPLLAHERVVAVGECGLDYHYDYSPRQKQRDVFAAQIAMAHRNDVALVIHTREAWDETFEILDREGVPERTIFHCFTGGADEAAASIQRGGMLSFSGIVTFKSADDVRAAVALCPLDRLLVETDSPYLAPVPHRGKPNKPAFVTVVGAAVAEVKDVTCPQIAQQTWDNAHRIYRLPVEDEF